MEIIIGIFIVVALLYLLYSMGIDAGKADWDFDE